MKKVAWYRMPAVQALSENVEPSGEGKIMGQSMMMRGGTMETSFLIECENGVVVEKFVDMVKVVTEEDEAAAAMARLQAAAASTEEKK